MGDPSPRKAADANEHDGMLEGAFARYQAELLGTLYYIVGNTEDARDALQETFLKCWRAGDRKLGDLKNLRAWMFRVALNTGRDMRKSAWRKRRQPLPTDDMIETQTANPAAEPLDREDQLARVRLAVAELRPEEQEVFLLRQNGALTYDQIAEAVGAPSGTVKTRMRQALAKLRAALSEES